MLVMLKGIGSKWSSRYPRGSNDPDWCAHGAFYNSTGIAVGHKVKYCWLTGGILRFNGSGSGFNPHLPLRSLNQIFECDELHQWNGLNRMAFLKCLHNANKPDCYLVVARSDEVGRIETLDKHNWKASSVQVISFSQHHSTQEVMLLMPAYSWIVTAKGTFIIEPSFDHELNGQLQLVIPGERANAIPEGHNPRE
jgi:hypothetical protein